MKFKLWKICQKLVVNGKQLAIYSTPVTKKRESVRAVFYLKILSVDKICSVGSKTKYMCTESELKMPGDTRSTRGTEGPIHFVHLNSHVERHGISHWPPQF